MPFDTCKLNENLAIIAGFRLPDLRGLELFELATDWGAGILNILSPADRNSTRQATFRPLS